MDEVSMQGHPEMREANQKLPTFLYVMPFGPNKIFLEETSLVSRPPFAFNELKERLEVRYCLVVLVCGLLCGIIVIIIQLRCSTVFVPHICFLCSCMLFWTRSRVTARALCSAVSQLRLYF